MRGKYRISHLLLPTYRHKYPPFSSISLIRMVLFSPTVIPHWQIMITQCIVHSWCPYFNIFYGFGQMSSNIYIHNHAKYFHCPKNSVFWLFIFVIHLSIPPPSPISPLPNTNLFKIATILTFPESHIFGNIQYVAL